MHGRLYLNTMHVDRANLIIRYLSIQWSDSIVDNSNFKVEKPLGHRQLQFQGKKPFGYLLSRSR